MVQIGAFLSRNFGSKNISSGEIVANCLASFRADVSPVCHVVRMLWGSDVEVICNTVTGS
jgi:hypothetical protein